jgi:cytoskeletal protein CcmA (bactofilin family)
MNTLGKIALVVYAQIALLAVSGTTFAETLCPPNVVNSDVIDDLTVNGFCVVTSNVTGDITVESSGFLIITGATVKGDIEIQPGGNISAQSIIVQGNVVGDSANSFVINNSFITEDPEIGGDVQSSGGNSAVLSGTVVKGDVELSDNDFAFVSSNIIGGDLECSGFVSESGNTVGGDKLGTCAD